MVSKIFTVQQLSTLDQPHPLNPGWIIFHVIGPYGSKNAVSGMLVVHHGLVSFLG